MKWFTEPTVETVRPYNISDGTVLLWIGIAIVFVLLGSFLEKKLSAPAWLLRRIGTLGPAVLSLATVGLGVALVIFSINGFIFAPNLPVGSSGTPLLILQAVTGVMFIFGAYVRYAGIVLAVLFFLAGKYFGAMEVIDAIEMIGFALFAFIVGRPQWQWKEGKWFQRIAARLQQYGVPLLRVGTGLNLVLLGFTEKILAPSLTQNFLMHYDWNFLQHFGVTDYWFAFSAGAAEALIGIFLMLGLVTRITTLVLAGFLVTTLLLLGPVELIGHLPHFSIAIVLLLFGAGNRLKLVKGK